MGKRLVGIGIRGPQRADVSAEADESDDGFEVTEAVAGALPRGVETAEHDDAAAGMDFCA